MARLRWGQGRRRNPQLWTHHGSTQAAHNGTAPLVFVASPGKLAPSLQPTCRSAANPLQAPRLWPASQKVAVTPAKSQFQSRLGGHTGSRSTLGGCVGGGGGGAGGGELGGRAQEVIPGGGSKGSSRGSHKGWAQGPLGPAWGKGPFGKFWFLGMMQFRVDGYLGGRSFRMFLGWGSRVAK